MSEIGLFFFRSCALLLVSRSKSCGEGLRCAEWESKHETLNLSVFVRFWAWGSRSRIKAQGLRIRDQGGGIGVASLE